MPNNFKILVVEDDSFLSQMYSAKLKLEGYQVLAAFDGEKALRLVKKDRPDLILLDLMLPKKNGFDVLAELKQVAETAAIPVIVLSNLGQKSDIDRCWELGAADYLIKAHFIPSEVINKIKQTLEKF